MIKKIRYFILALVCCMLVSAPVKAMAATLNYVSLGDHPFKDSSQGEYIYMHIAEDYITTGYPELGTYESYKKDGRLYGVYHVKHVFQDVFYSQFDSLNSDGFVLQSFDVSNRNINVSLSLNGASDYEVQILNVEKYAEINAGGDILKADFNYMDVFVDKPRLGPIIIYPVVEFDIVVDMQYSHIGETANLNSFTVNMSCTSNSASLLSIYGANYTSTGENSIISNIQNYGQSIISNIQTFINIMVNKFDQLFTKLDDIFSTDSTVISGAMDDYQSAEQEVFNPAMDSLTDFDFESHNISSLGTGFVAAITFVSSCLTGMYESTPFSVVFEVIATLGLASICIGLSRLWFGKKGR